MTSQTVFVAFRYCPLCRVNHNKGKKHVYSKRHQHILDIVLSKLLKKVTEAKEYLKKPAVQDLTWDQSGQKFWCYFCQEDVTKHRHNTTTFGDCILEYGGLLEHITRSDHLENTTKFLKENKLDMKRTAEFIISEKVYLKYLEDMEAVYSDHFMQKLQTLKQAASTIRYQSMVRCDILARSMQEKILPQQAEKQQAHIPGREPNWQKPAKDSFSYEERGKKTVQAFGEGLTSIDRLDEDDRLGNIYTNAVPPWMQPNENNEGSTGVIGPTIDDLEKHQKLEIKKQLPACRVGAKFDRKSNQAEGWLPDFGGVWNHGRRTKSGYQFLRRQSKSTKDSIHSSSAGFSSNPDSTPSSFHTSSYSFPKISKISATVTSSSEQHGNSSDNKCDTMTSDVCTDLQSSNNSHYFTTPNHTQKWDSFNNHGFEDARSQSWYPSEVMTSTVSNSLLSVSDSINDSFVAVKPYVRKNRTVATTVSEQSSFSESIYSPNMLGTFNMTTKDNMFGTHNSTNYDKLPPHLLQHENSTSTLGYYKTQTSNGVSFPARNYNSQRNQSYLSDKVQNNQPIRLIATPVLNQEKQQKIPLKKSHGSATFEK